MVLVNVAAEDFHRTHTNTKGKEGLIHGSRDNGPPTMLMNTVKTWQEQEGKTLHTARQHQAVKSKNDNKNQQGTHHNLCYLFKTTLNTGT